MKRRRVAQGHLRTVRETMERFCALMDAADQRVWQRWIDGKGTPIYTGAVPYPSAIQTIVRV